MRLNRKQGICTAYLQLEKETEHGNDAGVGLKLALIFYYYPVGETIFIMNIYLNYCPAYFYTHKDTP